MGAFCSTERDSKIYSAEEKGPLTLAATTILSSSSLPKEIEAVKIYLFLTLHFIVLFLFFIVS